MRFYAFLIAVILFTSAPVFAEQTDDAKKAECIAFYDAQRQWSDEAADRDDDEKINQLMEEDKGNKAWQLALEPYTRLVMITNRIDECAEFDERYFKAENDLCRGTLIDEAVEGIFNILAEKSAMYETGEAYCERAFKRADPELLLRHLFIDFTDGQNTERDFKKALGFIDLMVEKNPETKDAIFFTTPLYRRGGYGIEKDEAKAFEILKDLVETSPLKSNVSCELSQYYKNGIGTPKNEQEAEKWLKIYKDNNPDKECEFTDFDWMFRNSELVDEIYKEESVTKDAQ